MRSPLGWLGQVLAWLVILGVVVVTTTTVLVPRLAGATPYTVLTGSMAPTYPAGTLVVVKHRESYAIGDVITYQRESGKAAVVTHRVVEVGASLAGQTTYTTQGDANDVADAQPVMPVQVKGEVWYAVPYLGRVNTLLSGSQRQVAVYAVAVGLIGYAVLMFIGAARERRRTAPSRGPSRRPSRRPSRHPLNPERRRAR